MKFFKRHRPAIYTGASIGLLIIISQLTGSNSLAQQARYDQYPGIGIVAAVINFLLCIAIATLISVIWRHFRKGS